MKQTYSIELNTRQYQFLEQMVEKYSLVDVSKAMRCMIDFAIEESDKEQPMFEQIRCLDC